MAEYDVKEGWWSVRWPGDDGYDLVELVRVGPGNGLAAWGYRHRDGEDPQPLSSKAGSETQLNAMPAHAIKSLSQLVDETKTFGNKVFYRGHRRFEWELKPSVFRKTCKGDERVMLNNFRSRAPVRYSHCPDEADLCSWLCLAQHFGVPTRLLDWTLSPLVAAYFATEEHDLDDERAAAIWILSPLKLNALSSGNGSGLLTFTIKNERVRQLVEPAFDDESICAPGVLAVAPRQREMRLFVQQSMFTLHGDPASLEARRGEWLPDAERRSLMQCGFIPPSSKAEIRSDLERFGIHEASVFPDLGHLARYIARDERLWKPPAGPA